MSGGTKTAMAEIIAEIGSNWKVGGEDGLSRALRLIESAAKNGATTVKFQLFRAEDLYRDHDASTKLVPYELKVSWLSELMDCATQNGVEFLCTPFYLNAVEILERHGIKRYKIASWDLTYHPLLEVVKQTKKPVILSTGASTMEEVSDAIDILRPAEEYENPEYDLTLMHCQGGYPTRIEDTILRRVLNLATEFFPIRVGLSSHIPLPHIVASSVLFGATTIEVHYDLPDKKGIESAHSFSGDSFRDLVMMTHQFEQALDCNCDMTLADKLARNMYRRDPSDWLRPVINSENTTTD